jgi:hypothetical protein
MSATEQLEALQQQRAQASARISQLEQQWRQANEEAASAAATVAEVERAGASATARHKAEQALSTAKQRASEPWAQRRDGATQALRDVDVRIRGFVGEHLDELVASVEEHGDAIAARINTAASELVTAHAEWQATAARLGQLIATVSRPGPSDTSRSRSDEVARAATVLAASGGEEGVRLDRTRPPWDALLGGALEPEPEPAAVA